MEDMIKKHWKKRDMYYRSPGAKLPANICPLFRTINRMRG
jgi:hypothetical protein